MKKIKIFLADLTHTYKTISNPFMPYSVGLIASYAKKIYGDKIEIKLFKYPDKLYETLNKEKCDIIGCSTYIWNSNLAHWACKVAKSRNPNVITVLGGPDFGKSTGERINYFKNYKYVDIRVPLEGEVAFSNIIKSVMDNGIDNKKINFNNKIDGCVYLNRENNELIDSPVERIQELDLIPSPYLSGSLDEFFDGKLIPVIQTTRGCPFTCNFCVEGDKYYTKVKTFDPDRQIDELEYIGKKISETPAIRTLQIADSNYGMYKKDKLISEKVLDLQKKFNWPQAILVSTGKNFINVIDNTEMLMDTFDFSMSVQSMDYDVLDTIGRRNISPDKYKEAGEMLKTKGRSTLSETIVPLPRETLKTFFKGMMDLMDWKVSRIITNTVMFLHGTVYKNKQYVKDYKYKSKFRLLSGQFGIYGDEKVFEYEEVGVSTNTMTFEDYLQTRKFSFLVEILYNSKIFSELEFFLEDYNLKYNQYVLFVYKHLKDAHEDVQKVMNEIVVQSISELKNTEKSLVNYYSKKESFEKIMNGEEGGNVKYTLKALLISKYQDVWLDFVFTCLKKFLIKSKITVKEDEFNDIISFTKCKFDGVLDSRRTHINVTNSFNYDIINWINLRNKPLKKFKNKEKVKIKFSYDKNQVRERTTLFKEFSNDDTFSVANILERIRPQHKLYRKYSYVNS